MPSFLGRFIGLSFQTERLIMNILGLVNSTLDWSPIKWTNKLEQIWNLSLSQGTLILDVIGEDTIKTVLSWVVITRIVSAHVYTFTYMTNIYPIITWSQPNLLLPWLILSFFKNIVLEVIVIAVGLLLWYDKRFSLPIFLEFVLVKVVPLLLASYNWYSNSCMFLELRQAEKIKTLKRSLRSDSNFMTSRLYAKLADSKYRTRSLTTLLSYESYETYDTHDSIFDDPNLTPAQKTMKYLGITEQDIEDALIRIRERAHDRRLTEDEDDQSRLRSMNTSRLFSLVNDYGGHISRILQDVKNRAASRGADETKNETQDETVEEYMTDQVMDEDALDSEVADSGVTDKQDNEVDNVVYEAEPNIEILDDTIGDIQDIDPSISDRSDGLKSTGSPRTPKDNSSEEIISEHSSTKWRGKQVKQYSCFSKDCKHISGSLSRKRDSGRVVHTARHGRRAVEKSCSPVKLQALFNCNCILDDFKDKIEKYCLSGNATIRTSTPNGSPETERTTTENEGSTDASDNNPCTDNCHSCNEANERAEFLKSNSLPLIEKLLKNDLDILKNIKKDGQNLDSNIMLKNKPAQEVFKVSTEREASIFSKLYAGQCGGSVGSQHLTEIVKDLSVRDVVTNLETLKTIESDDNKLKLKTEEILRIMSVVDHSTTSVHRENPSPYKQAVEQTVLKVNLPEYSFGDTNIPRFYKDSMKVFDGCYEKDFANNSELQCLLQQLEKKKWSIFSDQPGQDIAMSSDFTKQSDPEIRLPSVPNIITASPNGSLEKIESYEISMSSTSNIGNYEQLMPQIVQVNEQRSLDDTCSLSDVYRSSSTCLTREAYTQTNDDDYSMRTSLNTSLVDPKRHKKLHLKRKRLKDARNVSPIGNLHEHKTESRSSILKDQAKSRQRPSRPNDKEKRPPHLTSDKQDCVCKIPRADNKHLNFPESKPNDNKTEGNKGCAARCRLENFGTIPLSQVVRPSMFDSLIYRRKPPAYPKKTRTDSPNQSVSNANAKKTSAIKKLLEGSKKPVETLPVVSSKKLKFKGRAETMEEQEARDMRALKAYNEVTLWKDKKELEKDKKRWPWKRYPGESGPESSRSRPQTNKKNDRPKKDTSRITEATDDRPDKENLLVDAATETEGLASTRDTKLPTVKMSSFASEKYTCPRLAKLNKVTDKLLSNFDRLQGGQMKQDSRRSKPASETDTRKPHTKYSRPKKTDEENVSVASIKKVEGAQKGRELERTPAREDVRDPATISVSSSTTEESLQLDSRQRCTNIADTFARINYDKVSSTYMDGMNLVERNDDLLMFKSTVIQEVTSSCSSSTIGQADELLLPVQDLNAFDEDETQMLVGHSRIPVRILDMEDRKAEVYTIAEDYNEMYAQQTQIETRNKEMYTIPGMEDRQTEVEDMSKHEIGTVTEIKKDKKEETDRPEVADASTVLVQEQIENLEKTDTIEEDIEIEELQEKLESQAKQISEDNSSNNELIEVEESKVSDLEVPTEGQEFEIGGSRSDSLEVSENRSERILRRPSRNMSDFVRNINMNYVANGVILSNSNAPRTNIPPQWDIVEDETVRTLQNALSYGSRDNPFDLMGEIVTMDDVLNLRSSESSADDFIFETSRESSNPSGVDFSREENTFRQTILATIRHLQNLEETDHDEAPCNLFITTIQRESLPIDLGMETVDHFEFEDEEDNEHPTINEFGDLLTQVFRALNIRGLHPSNISGLRFEILRNSFTEDEEEEDEGDDEESRKEERASMEEKLLRFIKEDIFTDIKFPIVVKMSDLIPGVIPPVEEEAEEIIGLRQMEASKINLFSLTDDKSEDGEDYLDDMIRNRYANGHLQDLEEDEESMFTAHSSKQFTSISDYNLVEPTIRDDRLASSYLDQPSTSSSVSPGLASNYKKYTMIRSEPLQVRKGATRDMLNRTYDLFPTPFKEEEGSTSSEEIEKEIEIDNLQEFKDGNKQLYKHSEVEESVNTEIERSFVKTVDESIQLTKFENEKTVEASRNEDTFRTNGNDSLSKEEEVKEGRDIGTEDETSLKIIFIFWMCVIIFYLKYFYKKVTSYKHNSTSTSTLKPFEIHTVPTSTSSLFEHVRYLGMQEEEVENDSLERIVDLEETDTSRSSDCNQLPDFDSSNCFRATYETSFKHVENKDDEVIWSDCVSENIQNPSGANALSEQNRDSLDTELRREEQIDSGILRPNIITNDVSLSVDDKIGKTDTTRFEEQRLIELRLAEKEIEAFRYKEDDDSSSSKSSPRREDEMKLFDDTKSYPCAELHIEEEKERPEAKEFDNSKKLNSSFLIEEKKCDELKEEESANDQTGNREKTNLETRSIKEVAGADEPQSPPEVLKTYLPTTDSFDSTYTKESETSKNATSTLDLNESSMEDFQNRSNESILES